MKHYLYHDVGGDGSSSVHIWGRSHLLSIGIKGPNGVLGVGLKCHHFPSSAFGYPNLEYAFSQKKCVPFVVIHCHCAEPMYPRCHCILKHFSLLFLNKLIHSFMYAHSYVHTYIHKFSPVGT